MSLAIYLLLAAYLISYGPQVRCAHITTNQFVGRDLLILFLNEMVSILKIAKFNSFFCLFFDIFFHYIYSLNTKFSHTHLK